MIMTAKNIDTLAARREQALLKFALKNGHSSKYGKKWFKETTSETYDMRATTREKYKLPFCKTNRMNGNPITVMTRALNNHYAQ